MTILQNKLKAGKLIHNLQTLGIKYDKKMQWNFSDE